MMGVGMAVAVLIDATIVRMVLVPATMCAARPGELVAAAAGSTGCCRTWTSRATTPPSGRLRPSRRRPGGTADAAPVSSGVGSGSR